MAAATSSRPGPDRPWSGGKVWLGLAASMIWMCGIGQAFVANSARGEASPLGFQAGLASLVALFSGVNMLRIMVAPAAWREARPWTGYVQILLALLMVSFAFPAFLGVMKILLQTDRELFQGAMRSALMLLLVGLAGLAVALAVMMKSKEPGVFLPFVTLIGAISVLPYLFPVSLAVILRIVVQQRRFLPPVSPVPPSTGG